MAVNKLKSGDRIFIQYVGDGLWHERLLLTEVGNSTEWVILRLDDDMYEESIAQNNPDISDVALLVGNQILRRLEGEQLYRPVDRWPPTT